MQFKDKFSELARLAHLNPVEVCVFTLDAKQSKCDVIDNLLHFDKIFDERLAYEQVTTATAH